MKLVAPECKLGYPSRQVEEIMGDRLSTFNRWMSGQTRAICDGRNYNHDIKAYEPSGCGPHGPVTYSWDVQRFLAGLPIID